MFPPTGDFLPCEMSLGETFYRYEIAGGRLLPGKHSPGSDISGGRSMEHRLGPLSKSASPLSTPRHATPLLRPLLKVGAYIDDEHGCMVGRCARLVHRMV